MVPWLVAAMMVACWGGALGVRWMRSGDPDASGSFNFEMVGVLFVIMGMLTLLVSGAACVAEERGLGTLEWQLTQPASVTRQWWVKILVAWGHFLLLGALLPAVLYLGLAGGKTAWPENASDFLLPAIVYGGVVVLVFSLAVYASSFSRSTMKAVAATLGLGLLIGLVPMPFVAWVGVRMDRLGTEFESGPVPAPAWEPGRDLVVGIGAVLLGLSVVGTMVLLLILGRRNFARASVSGSMLSRQLLGLVLWMIPLLLVTTECFLRLSRLEVQGNFHRMQETQKSRVRAALRSLLDWQLARNSVNAEFLRSFGLRTPASPRDVLGVVENIGDPGTGEQWVRILLVDVLRSAGVTNASAIENEVHSLVEQGVPPVRLIERRIREEAVRAKAAETSSQRPQYFRMDPFLARRYGLLPKAGSSPSTSDPKVTNPPTVPMDPDLARRYGLTPAAPKTEKAAPPP